MTTKKKPAKPAEKFDQEFSDAPAPKAPVKATESSAAVNRLAGELEVLRLDHVELKKDIRALVDLLAHQFGDPFTARAKEILDKHSGS